MYPINFFNNPYSVSVISSYEKTKMKIWGIDISLEQIKQTQNRFPQFKDNFLVSQMEKEANIPNNYFDYIISIFSIGYTSDLSETLKNAYKYLRFVL